MRPKICGNLDKNWPVNWSIGVPIVLIAEDKELAAYGIPGITGMSSGYSHLHLPLYYKGVQIYATSIPGFLAQSGRKFSLKIVDLNFLNTPQFSSKTSRGWAQCHRAHTGS